MNEIKRLIINIIPFLDLVFFKKHISFEIIQHALGIKTKVMQDSIPKNAQAKVVNWFRKMASNKSQGKVYDTSVLMVGHFHHHFSVEVDHRLVLCSTAYDLSGQQWFSEQGGGSALHGVTAFLMHNKEGRKWSDINIY